MMLTMDNVSAMGETLELLSLDDGAIVSVGFLVEDGRILCLSLVTATVCVNIDRTIMKQGKLLKTMTSFKELFQGSTILFVGDMWELTLLLYHRYQIRCNAFRDVEEFSTEGAGDAVPISNFEVHRSVANKAVLCYNDMHESETCLAH